jgi:hypothetical protein
MTKMPKTTKSAETTKQSSTRQNHTGTPSREGKHAPSNHGKADRRARLYAGSLASLGCYAAAARDWAVGVPGAADREAVALRSSTPR